MENALEKMMGSSRDGVIEPKLCLGVTDALGFVDIGDGRVAEEAKLYGDMNEVSKLPVLDVAFARPSRITVCADAEFVHSIMLSLKVHEPNLVTPAGEETDETLLQDSERDFEKDIAMLQHSNISYNMNPVGMQVPPCTRIDIADDDRIVGIDAESDGLTLRKVTVHL